MDGIEQMYDVWFHVKFTPRIVTMRKPTEIPIWFIKPNRYFLSEGATSLIKVGQIVEYKPIVEPLSILNINAIVLLDEKPSNTHESIE